MADAPPPAAVDLAELAALRRRATVLAWGIVLIVLGALAGLGTLATLLDVLNASNGPGATGRPLRALPTAAFATAPTGSGFGTSVFVLAAAAAIVGTGIGLCTSRRRTRPATRILAWYAIGFGLPASRSLANAPPRRLPTLA